MGIERSSGSEVVETSHFHATRVRAWVVAKLQPKNFESIEVGYELERDLLLGETPVKAITEMSAQVLVKFEKQCTDAFKAIGCELGDR